VEQIHEEQSPVLKTERFLLVKVDDAEDEIKEILVRHDIRFEDFIVHSIVPDA